MIEVMVMDRSPDQQAQSIALLAVVADPVRWRLIAELAASGTRCVCDLQPVGAVAPNVLSYHLKVLREAGLVTASKRGRWVDYTLADDVPARLRSALPTAGALPTPGVQHTPRLLPSAGETVAQPPAATPAPTSTPGTSRAVEVF